MRGFLAQVYANARELLRAHLLKNLGYSPVGGHRTAAGEEKAAASEDWRELPSLCLSTPKAVLQAK